VSWPALAVEKRNNLNVMITPPPAIYPPSFPQAEGPRAGRGYYTRLTSGDSLIGRDSPTGVAWRAKLLALPAGRKENQVSEDQS
jgi:hypothetical protein